MKRRTFVKSGLATGATLLAATPLQAKDAIYKRTPRDVEGPFYPVGSRDNDSNDLILRAAKIRGDVVNLSGDLVDVSGQPIASRIIDIWHTDPLGRYKHPRDGKPGERFDDFAYWGQAITDPNGRYTFRTYVPGAYGGRPAHIHFKVRNNSRVLLTSQIYFRETGGTDGQARSSDAEDLQVAGLRPAGDGIFETDFRIVI